MIPRDYITEWRATAPWVQDFQVEQDLVISRALVEIFSNPVLHDALAFRGGTALYKLHLRPPARCSEDIDLVQTRAAPAGPMMEALRATLDPDFLADIGQLLSAGYEWNPEAEAVLVREHLIAQLPGEPWKGTG